MISKVELQQMFRDMEQRSRWDMSKDKLWGYFFNHWDRPELDHAAQMLAAQGYRVVDIYLAHKNDPAEADLWWLHVERVETHSPASLHQRNTEFAHFAAAQGLESYDGMDVGPLPLRH